MDVRQFAFLARQPSAALQPRDTFWGLSKRGFPPASNTMITPPRWVKSSRYP